MKPTQKQLRPVWTVAVLLPVLGALLAMAGGMSGGTSGGKRSIEIPYFDVEQGKMVLVEYRSGDTLDSPIKDTQIYRCTLFTCSECQEVTEGMTEADLAAMDMFVGYLMRDAPAADDDDDDEFLLTMEARLVDGEAWVDLDSDEGAALVQGVMRRCEDGNARQCGVRPRKR